MSVGASASWIIARDGRALCETYSRKEAEFAEAKGFDVFTAKEWLASLNLKPGDAA